MLTMDTPIMQYVKELKEIKEYLFHSNKRLKLPFMEVIDDDKYALICDLWRVAITKPYDEKFKMLTSRGYKNKQDCMDALDDLKSFKKQIINTLEN